MKKMLITLVAAVCLCGVRALAQTQSPPVNAALRYWMAFAVMKDPPDGKNGITLELMDRIAAGTAPLDDRVARVLDDNREALEIMRRASALPSATGGSSTSSDPLRRSRIWRRGACLDASTCSRDSVSLPATNGRRPSTSGSPAC